MYPTAEDFSDIFESFVHKYDGIGIELVKGLADALNRKLERSEAAGLELKTAEAVANAKEALRLLSDGLDRISQVEDDNKRTRELAESLLGENLEETAAAFAALREFLEGLDDSEGLAETLDSLRRLVNDIGQQVVMDDFEFVPGDEDVAVRRRGKKLDGSGGVGYTKELTLPVAEAPFPGDDMARPRPGQAGIVTGADFGRFDSAATFAEGLADETAIRDIGFSASADKVSFTRSKYRLGGGNPWVDADGSPEAVPIDELWPFPMSSQTSAGAVTAAQARAIANAPELAFRELWKSAGCSVKEDADPSEMYACNGLGMSYAEARAVYAAGVMTNDNRTNLYANCNIRTHLPHRIHTGVTTCPHTFRYSRVEVVNASLLIPGDSCFLGCSRLRKVTLYSPMAAGASYANAYQGCSALETLVVYGSVYARSFSLADSPLISLASLQGIIAKTQPGMAAFTITLHPDSYAKMTDTERESEWTQLPALAAEKNITFTTNR